MGAINILLQAGANANLGDKKPIFVVLSKVKSGQFDLNMLRAFLSMSVKKIDVFCTEARTGLNVIQYASHCSDDAGKIMREYIKRSFFTPCCCVLQPIQRQSKQFWVLARIIHQEFLAFIINFVVRVFQHRSRAIDFVKDVALYEPTWKTQQDALDSMLSQVPLTYFGMENDVFSFHYELFEF